MRIFRNVPFRRFMQENGIGEMQVCAVVEELTANLIHANLGGGVYKQRLARQGKGKSGGFRTIVFFKVAERAFFVLGFAKSDQANLSTQDLRSLKDLAKELFSYDEKRIGLAIGNGTLQELFCE